MVETLLYDEVNDVDEVEVLTEDRDAESFDDSDFVNSEFFHTEMEDDDAVEFDMDFDDAELEGSLSLSSF